MKISTILANPIGVVTIRSRFLQEAQDWPAGSEADHPGGAAQPSPGGPAEGEKPPFIPVREQLEAFRYVAPLVSRTAEHTAKLHSLRRSRLLWYGAEDPRPLASRGSWGPAEKRSCWTALSAGMVQNRCLRL